MNIQNPFDVGIKMLIITNQDGELVSNVINLSINSDVKKYKDLQIFHMQSVIENEKHDFIMLIAKRTTE